MKTLNIRIPNNNLNERHYIINTLISEYLNIPCKISIDDNIKEYQLEYLSQKLIIDDYFFSKNTDILSYINLMNIPSCVTVSVNVKYCGSKDLIIIYGNDYLDFDNNTLRCGIDIFASAFYMLSRWEEAVLDKDEFGRCNEDSMLAIKHGFYMRPVVNEYVDFLKEVLTKMGINVSINRNFKSFITHDVDDLFRFESFKNFCKNLGGDLLHRKSLIAFYKTCTNFILYKIGLIKDPFDTFDYLMDLSDRYGFKSSFFFIPLVNNEKGSTYNIFDKKVKKIIDNINPNLKNY